MTMKEALLTKIASDASNCYDTAHITVGRVLFNIEYIKVQITVLFSLLNTLEIQS